MSGHLFVVHGRMEALVKDAVVVTTDADFTIEPHWQPVLGKDDVSSLRPQDWAANGRGFGAATGRPDLWFLEVSGRDPSLDDLLANLQSVVDAIASSGLEPSAGRAVPLVAVPVPGVGGGGLRHRAGAVIAGLVRTLGRLVERLEVDVVIVATTEAQFAAVQRERRRSASFDLPAEVLDKARDIGAEAAAGSLALFLGGGVSVPSGLPSWTQLVEEVRAAAVRRGANIPDREFAAMGLLDQTELLHTVLRGDLESIVAERFRSATPALSHALLASLRCVESVTTNYDDCYETAVAAQDPHTRLVVMPWQKPDGGSPWLLKLHGDARRPETVVLTRGQFIGYDSRWRPVGSVFQSLLMTRKLLVVGASLSDDNVLRLAHEVRALRQRHDIEEPLGYVLSLGPEPMRAQLWSGELEWVALDGPTAEDQARSLEIFLDAVLTHATHGAPYLLHPDFADLLDGREEAELADLARSLAARIADADCERRLRHDAGWPEILAMLRSFGAEV